MLVKNAFSPIALIFLFIVLTSFTFKRGNSFVSIIFKGKKFFISNADDKLKNVYGHTLAKSFVSNNETVNISFIGICAFSGNLNIDLGAVKQGIAEGVYDYRVLRVPSKDYYFGIYAIKAKCPRNLFCDTAFFAKNSKWCFFRFS